MTSKVITTPIRPWRYAKEDVIPRAVIVTGDIGASMRPWRYTKDDNTRAISNSSTRQRFNEALALCQERHALTDVLNML